MKNLNLEHIVLLGSDPDKPFFCRIRENASVQKIQTTFINYSEIEFSTPNQINDILDHSTLKQIDRGTTSLFVDICGPYSAARDVSVRYFLDKKCPTINGNSYLKFSSINKLVQHYCLHINGIPVPPTNYFSSRKKIIDYFHHAPHPLVLKSIFGSQGTEVYKISSLPELLSILEIHHPQDLLIQTFLNNVQEYRVVVLGNTCVGTVLKVPTEGEFRTNSFFGAHHSIINPPEIVQELAVRTCQVLACDFAGVDILFDGKSFWVLEINRLFNFKGFERITKINLAHKLIIWMNDQVKT